MIPRRSLLENITQFRKYVRMPLDTCFPQSSTSQSKKHKIKFSRPSHEPGAGAQVGGRAERCPTSLESSKDLDGGCSPVAGGVVGDEGRPEGRVRGLPGGRPGRGAGGSAAAGPRGGTAHPRVGPQPPSRGAAEPGRTARSLPSPASAAGSVRLPARG